MNPAVHERIPHEIVASVLAATTAFVGGTALHLPPWAIFISWAGVFLLGGPSLFHAKRLWCAMPVGSAYALLIVLLETNAGTAFGDGRLARNAFAALCILVLNSALMYTGRIPLFSLVPGMFFGFASYFATYFGGFGYDPGNPWAAWVCVVAMNALGPVYAWLSMALTFSVPRAADGGGESDRAADGGESDEEEPRVPGQSPRRVTERPSLRRREAPPR